MELAKRAQNSNLPIFILIDAFAIKTLNGTAKVLTKTKLGFATLLPTENKLANRPIIPDLEGAMKPRKLLNKKFRKFISSVISYIICMHVTSPKGYIVN